MKDYRYLILTGEYRFLYDAIAKIVLNDDEAEIILDGNSEFATGNKYIVYTNFYGEFPEGVEVTELKNVEPIKKGFYDIHVDYSCGYSIFGYKDITFFINGDRRHLKKKHRYKHGVDCLSSILSMKGIDYPKENVKGELNDTEKEL